MVGSINDIHENLSPDNTPLFGIGETTATHMGHCRITTNTVDNDTVTTNLIPIKYVPSLASTPIDKIIAYWSRFCDDSSARVVIPVQRPRQQLRQNVR